MLMAYHDKFNSPPKPRDQKRQNHSAAFVFLGIATVVVFMFAKADAWPIHVQIFKDELYPLSGIIPMTIGFYTVAAARAVLNGYWGPHIYLYKDPIHNILIQKGIYGHLRHPIYLGQVLMATGTFMMSNSTVFLLFLIPLIAINIIRSMRESQHLFEIFGKDFEHYKNNTSWLIPGVI